MNHFTPYDALAGGALIGLAAALLLWLNGRIAGISGIAGRLWFSPREDRLWRMLFLGGLVAGTAAWFAFGRQPAAPRSGFPPGALVLAGLLVGYGTSMSGGCTSGHGVCGVARFSLRSIVATCTFLAAGVATTCVVRHWLHVA